MDPQSNWKIREDGRGWDFKPKIVGKPSVFDPGAALKWNSDMIRLSPNVGRWQPRGVFRFKTWEEFNEWKASHQNPRT